MQGIIFPVNSVSIFCTNINEKNKSKNKNSNFDEDVECDDKFPDDHPDEKLAGRAKVGTSCYIKCKPGFKFVDHKEATFKVTCKETWYFGLEFDVFDDAWDKYEFIKFL